MLNYQRVIQSPFNHQVALARRARRTRFRLELHANQVLGQALREVRHEELALCFAVENVRIPGPGLPGLLWKKR